MDIPTKNEYTIRSLLFSSAAWIVVMTVISSIKRVWKPQPCLTLGSVSGFYGPGAYWGWILTILSAMVDMESKDEEDGISPDFVAACLYTLVAMVDVQFRLDITQNAKKDLQLQAALHIVYAGLVYSSIAFIFGRYLFQPWHIPRHIEAQAFSGPWKFRIWAPFMLLTTLQTLSTWHVSRAGWAR
ncbi:hypothetical protein CPB86DRAFT_316763 [Serendipita vermifera]|nr:hypothetical protein CPB86DRAFT_316763 [Serendipita vermifera]